MVGTHDAFTTALLHSTKFEGHPDLGRSTLQITQPRFSRHDVRIEFTHRIAQPLEQSGLCCRVLVSCFHSVEFALG